MYLLTHRFFFRKRILKKHDTIYNMTGTGHLQARSGSWKQHWIDYGKRSWPRICQRRSCTNPAEDGAHINIGRGSRGYIFPLCSTCNVGITGEMEPKANSLAVLALKRDIVD